jgi:hypothetical protein
LGQWRGEASGEEEEMAAVVLSVGDWGRGEERRRGAASVVQRGRGGAHFIGPRGGGEEVRRPAAVEF